MWIKFKFWTLNWCCLSTSHILFDSTNSPPDHFDSQCTINGTRQLFNKPISFHSFYPFLTRLGMVKWRFCEVMIAVGARGETSVWLMHSHTPMALVIAGAPSIDIFRSKLLPVKETNPKALLLFYQRKSSWCNKKEERLASLQVLLTRRKGRSLNRKYNH